MCPLRNGLRMREKHRERLEIWIGVGTGARLAGAGASYRCVDGDGVASVTRDLGTHLLRVCREHYLMARLHSRFREWHSAWFHLGFAAAAWDARTAILHPVKILFLPSPSDALADAYDTLRKGSP
jgi:hypothetical protein